MVSLVTSPKEVIANIVNYNGVASELSSVMSNVHAWYATRNDDGGWIFGPSKFIGYAKMDVDTYRNKKELGMDGRVTESVLRQWFVGISNDDEYYAELWSSLVEFCAKFGKKPSSIARISVFMGDADAIIEDSDVEVVELLAAVYRRLSQRNKKRFMTLIA